MCTLQQLSKIARSNSVSAVPTACQPFCSAAAVALSTAARIAARTSPSAIAAQS
jgi:hypothetical protein